MRTCFITAKTRYSKIKMLLKRCGNATAGIRCVETYIILQLVEIHFYLCDAGLI